MEPRRWIQAVSFGISFVAFFVVLYRLRYKNRNQICIALMPLVFIIHTVVYYAAVFWLGAGMILHGWSSGLILHGLITIIILSYIAASSLKTNE